MERTPMDQARADDHHRRFAALHDTARPLVLVNVWDAGSARVAADAGAPALATGSWAVAAAHGYADGEQLPLPLALDNLRRITAAVDIPVSADIERGYGDTPDEVATTAAAFQGAGAVGINLEDALTDTTRRAAEDNAARIRSVRARTGEQLWINARTDVFFQTPPEQHEAAITEVIERSHAYEEAGADSLFVPGLTHPHLIQILAERASLPINIMATTSADVTASTALGACRISMGPGPYLAAMDAVAAIVATHSPPR
ncbi:isocitrate lyase/PEP mutase family protein [Janibacter indicus]